MKKVLWLFAITFSISTSATWAESGSVPTFQQTGKATTMTWPAGKWDGKHQFQKVYCAFFPVSEDSLELQSVMFNQNSINLASVDYPELIRAAIMVSTIPKGRSVDEEIARMVKNEKRVESETGVDTHVTQFNTAFGPTIGLRINNMAPGSENGPFPLDRAFFNTPGSAIKSMSIHRLFARGGDRFEVAILQYVPDGANLEKQKIMEKQLTTLADNLTTSLQECTVTQLK
ncbi:MAG: hypothetical protein WBL28_04285 [Methylotenera sp.]